MNKTVIAKFQKSISSQTHMRIINEGKNSNKKKKACTCDIHRSQSHIQLPELTMKQNKHKLSEISEFNNEFPF